MRSGLLQQGCSTSTQGTHSNYADTGKFVWDAFPSEQDEVTATASGFNAWLLHGGTLIAEARDTDQPELSGL